MGKAGKRNSRRELRYSSITESNLESQKKLRDSISNTFFAIPQKRLMGHTIKKRLLRYLAVPVAVQNALKERHSNNQTLYSEPSIEESMKCLTIEYIVDNQKHSFKIPVKDIDNAFKQAFPNL